MFNQLFRFLAAATVFPIAVATGCLQSATAEDTALAAAQASADPVENSLVYKTIDGQQLRIDWTRPADWRASDSRSAVVFIHGGAWVSGEPGQFSKHSTLLAKRGCVCFRVQYRLLDKKTKNPPTVCIEDVSDAIRYVRFRAGEFGIDPSRIAAGGGSAGGHLAAFLGMMEDEPVNGVSRKPNALLLFNPVYDNGPGEWGVARVKDEFQKYSPAHNISTDDPPAIVFLGTNDRLIPVSTAERFRDRMRAVGLESQLHLYEGQPHGFFNAAIEDGKYYRLTVSKMTDFLERLGWFK